MRAIDRIRSMLGIRDESNSCHLPIQIHQVQSNKSNAPYHMAIPRADTDMVTNGLLLATKVNVDVIELHYANKEEYSAGPIDGGIMLARRLNLKNGTTDYRPVVSRSDNGTLEFLDKHSNNDWIISKGEISLESFLATGGEIKDDR